MLHDMLQPFFTPLYTLRISTPSARGPTAVFITVSTDSSLKSGTTTQQKQSLHFGAFPERPGDASSPFTSES